MPAKPRIEKRCEWRSQRDDKACTRWATHRNPEQDLWLCTLHKNWVPGKKPGRVPEEVSESTKVYRAKKKRDRKNYKGNLDKCAFTTVKGMPCQAMPMGKLEDGRRVCPRHKKLYNESDAIEKDMMEKVAVDTMMAQKVPALKASQNFDRKVADMPDIEEQLDELDKMADDKDEHSVRFKKDPRKVDSSFKTGTAKSAFFGIDVEYYTPEFKYDYVYMLMTAIRRAEAQVNIYFQQLQRIEKEEEELKQTIRSGTMIGEKGIMEFSNTETRNAIPIELKLKLMDNLTKAEAHYAKLLKQLQELPLVALMVLRKMGVRWDRDAAMMVMTKIEKQENQVLTDFGAINPLPTQEMPLQQMVDLVQEDPKMAAKFKNIAQDDDW